MDNALASLIGIGITVIIGAILTHIFNKGIKTSQITNSNADAHLKTAQASATLIEQMEIIVNNYKEIVKNTRAELELTQKRCDQLEILVNENKLENERLKVNLIKLQEEFNLYKLQHE